MRRLDKCFQTWTSISVTSSEKTHPDYTYTVLITVRSFKSVQVRLIQTQRMMRVVLLIEEVYLQLKHNYGINNLNAVVAIISS